MKFGYRFHKNDEKLLFSMNLLPQICEDFSGFDRY